MQKTSSDAESVEEHGLYVPTAVSCTISVCVCVSLPILHTFVRPVMALHIVHSS